MLGMLILFIKGQLTYTTNYQIDASCNTAFTDAFADHDDCANDFANVFAGVDGILHCLHTTNPWAIYWSGLNVKETDIDRKTEENILLDIE